LTIVTWKTWSGRFRDWCKNPVAPNNRAAFAIAGEFLRAQAKNGKDLPRELGQDAVALYLLGEAYLAESRKGNDKPVQRKWAELAEHQFHWSKSRDKNFAPAYYGLAQALLRKDATSPKGDAGAIHRAREEMAEARRLGLAQARLTPKAEGWLLQRANQPDEAVKLYRQALKENPNDSEARKLLTDISKTRGAEAFKHNNFGEAEKQYRQALTDDPRDEKAAEMVAKSILHNQGYTGSRAQAIKPILDRFPDNGRIVTVYGVSLGNEGDPKAAVHEFDRARSLGTDPLTAVHPSDIKRIEAAAQPTWWDWFVGMMNFFVIFYAIVMALMAAGGLLLARMNKGRRAEQLLGERPTELVAQGQAVRTSHESLLTRLYGVALLLGLVFFYFSIPFVILGLLFLTLVAVILMFFLGRSYQGQDMAGSLMKAGGGGTWAVLQCLFARFADGSFGVHKTKDDCPRLYQVLEDVARRVNTDPVTDVYIHPRSEIGVHQEGRGPFGIFGIKRRVLTLGLSTMHFLTVSEFQSIMAHEYAHFSHSDTFYSRFIYQVSLSISRALQGMAKTGGWFTYVNPFYGFFYLYNKTYKMLSAGFSRSREYLADRMACSLYGSNTFASGLTKVCTDGTLFEMTIHHNIERMLDKKKAYINMYEEFRRYRDEQLDKTEREKLYKKLLDEKESLFASHPTFAERMDAIKPLPKALKTNENSALRLFENPAKIEEELTDFLTEVMSYVRKLRRARA
jgi:Zn-dependent protease with chaperone function/Flp pilus assembly protein TadD